MPYRPPPLGPKTLKVSDPAKTDIDKILDYLAQEASVETSLRFADKIDTELSRLAATGHSGVSREWLSHGLRLTLIASYAVYFRVTSTEIVIVRVIHGSRDIAAIDFEDPA